MKSINAKKRVVRAVGWVLPIFMLFAAGCGGGGSDTPATVDLTGSWEVTETITEADGVCADNLGDTFTWSADVVQTGNSATVTITGGDNVGTVFTGTISGSTIDWQGTYPTAGGTTTVTGSNVEATNTSLVGTASWEWSDSDNSCTGTTRLSGNKTGA